MLELFVLILVGAVFLPDLLCGTLLALLWLAEKGVTGVCRLLLALLALWAHLLASIGAATDSASSPRSPLPPAR